MYRNKSEKSQFFAKNVQWFWGAFLTIKVIFSSYL